MSASTGVRHWPPVNRLLSGLHASGLFAAAPVIVARAPGRLDVMGGIADYSGSLVCEMPLEAATAVAAQRREDGQVVCSSVQAGGAATLPLEALRHADPLAVRRAFAETEGWARYMAGCLWWLLRHGQSKSIASCRGVTLHADSDVPLGGGVSSSAAIEVATMTALAALLGESLPPLVLAAACQEVENRVVGAPCGVMDQVTACLGQAGCMLEILCQPDGQGMPAQVRGPVHVPAGYAFVGLHSGVRHEVKGDPYTDTRVAAFIAQKLLTSPSFKEPAGCLATIDAAYFAKHLRAKLPAAVKGSAFLEKHGGTNDPVTTVAADKVYTVRDAATHHVLEMARVTEFVALLKDTQGGAAEREARMRRAGDLMVESHRSYGDCAHMGHEMTDRLVEMVQDRGRDLGLYGAKITGGGCGGTVAILISDDAAARQEVQMIRLRYEMETGRKTAYFEGTSPGAAALGTQTLAPREWM